MDYKNIDKRSPKNAHFTVNHGKKWMWEGRNEPLRTRHIKPNIKFCGGSIMIWECIISKGVGLIEKTEGRMTVVDYFKSKLIMLAKFI